MKRILVFIALYCVSDSILFLKYRIRLQRSHFQLLKNPWSFFSSGKKILSLLLLLAPLLWMFPWFSIPCILVTKWPHPLWLLFRRKRKKNLASSFPFQISVPQGQKLFDIHTEDKPHILFISLESFRAKNVGCLGAKQALSPHFDRLAKRGLLFTNFHATGNLTNRSILSTLCGVPPAHEPWHLGHYADLPLVGLPRLLAKHGYYPTVIQGGSTAFDHEAEFFEKHGFQTILGKRNIAKPGTSWGIYDEHLMTTAALWLKTQKVPTFLNLYTITNHHPWIHPEKKHGFLNTFAYTDKALQILIDALADGDLLKKSILFIYGDHGQQLEDRGPHFEVNRDLYQDNIHVPLLILAEGRIDRPRTIDTLSSQVDLLPTLLDLLHIHTPHQSLGKSLLYPSNAPIFFSHPFDTPAKGCREGPWKYIVSDEKECLYHLEKDPDETVNRIVEGTSLRKKTEEFFASLDTYYSEIPPEKIECSMHLDFTNSLKMTDAMLLEIAKKHPNLSSLSLDGCLLITNQGIASFLQLCPNIEKLYLDGLDDISSAGWENLPHLVHLKAIDCPHMTLDWIQNLPSLRVLQLGASKLSDEDLQKLAKTQRNLNAIYFSNLQHITDAGLIPLLSANQNLMILSIRDCPNITKSAFEAIQSKILRYKWLA